MLLIIHHQSRNIIIISPLTHVSAISNGANIKIFFMPVFDNQQRSRDKNVSDVAETVPGSNVSELRKYF